MGRLVFVCLAAMAGIFAAPALAETALLPVSITAGPLPYALANLERQTGIELLFDRDAVKELDGPTVSGKFTTKVARRQLLTEANLVARRADSGAWIVESPLAPPLAQPDAQVPEVLIIGKHTKNADLRRFENDVQPYTVATKAQLLASHCDNIYQVSGWQSGQSFWNTTHTAGRAASAPVIV